MANSSALNGGMPVYKYLANKFLTAIENFILNQSLSEFHTGYRAYSKKLLKTIPFMLNSDNFVFDTEIIVQTVMMKFKIAEISCPTRYLKNSSSINFKNSLVYGFQTLLALSKFILHKTGLKKFKFFSPTN